MKYSFIIPIALILWINLQPVKSQTSTLAIGFAETQLADGLDPTAMTQSPDGRIFVVEKFGKIRVLREDILLDKPFLNLSVDNKNERGLLGLAFDPSFPSVPYFYIYYTVPDSNFNRVSRFRAEGDVADPSSEEIIFDLKTGLALGNVHQGGQMQFGPDGKLYIAVGDGSLGLEAQVLTNVLGSILRINPDGSIPEDNPYFAQAEGLGKAVWALGLRNPYTFAFQPGKNRLFANDVGSNRFEEINIVESGLNFGWPLIEGYIQAENPPENYRDPIYAFGRNAGCSVIGAAFYSPQTHTFPDLFRNKFLFGDYCLGYIKLMDPETGNVLSTLADGIVQLVSILVHKDGDVYYMGRGNNGFGVDGNTSTSRGSLWKISYVGSGAPNISIQPGSFIVPEGESATFSIKASGKLPLAYQWLKDGLEIPGANSEIYTYPNVGLEDDGSEFSCLVSNDEGTIASEAGTLRVTQNTRPTAQIIFPQVGTLYKAGDIITFQGAASDAEDTNLDITWQIDLHHDEHTHPALAPVSGITQGTYIVPIVDHKEDLNVWLRIYMRVEDQGGLTRTIYRDIFPEKTNINLLTKPSGMRVLLEGKSVSSPFVFESVVGMERTVESFSTQFFNDTLWLFTGWEADQGNYEGKRVDFQAGEPVTSLTALHDAAPIGTGRGLLGEYFQDDFENEPLISRVDPVINFNWRGKSPDSSLFRSDFYKVRWTGFIEAQFTDTYTFHMLIDDGVRLWIDEELIIDDWKEQGATEVSGSKEMVTGEKVPIQIEYFEHGFLASVSLEWSTLSVKRHIVPQTQLYPPGSLDIEEVPETALMIFPVPFGENLIVRANPFLSNNIRINIFDMIGRKVYQREIEVSDQTLNESLNLQDLLPGVYLIEILDPAWDEVLLLKRMLKQ